MEALLASIIGLVTVQTTILGALYMKLVQTGGTLESLKSEISQLWSYVVLK